MRLIVIALFSLFAFNAFSASKKALIIDSKAFIKYSSVRYKNLTSYKDRDTGTYYYFNQKNKDLLRAITNLEGVDVFLIDSLIGKRINTAVKKLGLNDFNIKEIIKVRRNKINGDLLASILGNYSEVKYFAYNKQAELNIKRVDLGTYTKFYANTQDAIKALSKLSKKNRKKYSYLYPTTDKSFTDEENQNRKMITKVFNYSEGLSINDRSPINVLELKDFLINGYTIQWQYKKAQILSEIVNQITNCSLKDKKSKKELSIDNQFCLRNNKFVFKYISDDGYATGRSCYSVAGKKFKFFNNPDSGTKNLFYKRVNKNNCKDLPRKFKWQSVSQRVITCDIVDESSELIIESQSDTQNCQINLGYKYLWKFTSDTVSGCHKTTNNGALITKENNNKHCLDSLGSMYVWNYSQDQKSVISCSRVTRGNNKVIEKDITISNCLITKLSNSVQTNFQHDKNNVITGCMDSVSLDNAFIRSKSITNCVSSANVQFAWLYDQANTKVTACRKYDSNTNLNFPNTKLKDCIGKLKVDYYWKHKDKAVISCEEVTFSSPNKPLRKMPTFANCENNSGLKYNFEKTNGKVSACTKRSNWKNLLISTSADLAPCLANLPQQVTSRIIYDKNKLNIKTCGTKLVSGEELPATYNGTCTFKTGLLISNTNDSIKGCFEINPNDGRGLNKLSITKCIPKGTAYEYDYLLSTTDKTVKGCYVIDSKNKLPILDLKVNLDDCRSSKTSYYAWKGVKTDTCLEFDFATKNATYYKIGQVSKNECHDSKHALFDKEISSYQFVAGSNLDSNLSYIENITANQSDMHELAKEYISVYKHFIIKTDREITTYNYRDRKLVKGNGINLKRSGAINLHSKIAIDYANEWMDAIRKFLPDESGMLGWGLYTANNPVESKEYGGSDWAMVAVDLPAGSNILDIRSMPSAYFPVTRRAWELYTNNCGRPQNYKHPIANDKVYAAISKGSLSKCAIGHKAFIKALKVLDINAISYDWDYRDIYLNNQRPLVCDSSITNATFVIVETPLNSNTVRLIVPEGTEKPTKSELQWHTYVNNLASEFTRTTLSKTNSYSFDRNKDQGYINWKNNNQFACKSAHKKTDRMKK
jgi:hypothetical protein